MFKYLTSITKIAHKVMGEYVKEGMSVVDGTIGNGYDTVFLAKKVGQTGKVYGFDIQLQAITATERRLNEENIRERVELIHDGHEKIEQYIKGSIDAAMYNLGYLPKGDHKIITKPNTTLLSLQKCLKNLKSHGLISVAVYYGHDGGAEEKKALEKFFNELDHKFFTVMKMDFMNKENDPPILFIIEKL